MGLSVTSCADVILVGTSVRGNNGCEGGVISDINAGVAVVVSFSTLHAYECTFRGGDAFTAYSMSWSNGEAGLKENGSSFVMLSGCQISGGDSACWDYGFCAGYPGTGFKHNSGQAYALDTTIQAGAPGSAGLSCTCSRPDHTGAGTVQVLSGQALDLRTDSPKREGETFTYTIVGPPNVPVWLGTSLRTGGQFLSSFRGSVLIGLPPLSLRSVGTTDATGALSVTQVVPSILTGPSGIRLFVQPYYSSPIVLGRGACVLALDSSL
jgi:hypothetical protein